MCGGPPLHDIYVYRRGRRRLIEEEARPRRLPRPHDAHPRRRKRPGRRRHIRKLEQLLARARARRFVAGASVRENGKRRRVRGRARGPALAPAKVMYLYLSTYLYICLSILLSNLSIQKSIHPSISWIRAPALVPAPRKAGTPPASAPPRAAASPAAAIHASRRPVAAQRGIGVYGTWKRQVRSCAVNSMVESEEKIDGQFRILKRSPPLDAFDVSCF